MPEPDWISLLKYMLCQMYKQWGGDCTDLPFNVSEQITTLENLYDTEGDPLFENPAELQAFLTILSGTVTLLNSANNSLSEADDARLRTLISKLQADLTPPTS